MRGDEASIAVRVGYALLALCLTVAACDEDGGTGGADGGQAGNGGGPPEITLHCLHRGG